MALVKILNEGDKLLFTIGGQEVSMALKSTGGSKVAVFEIKADRSVVITAVTEDKIQVGTPR